MVYIKLCHHGCVIHIDLTLLYSNSHYNDAKCSDDYADYQEPHLETPCNCAMNGATI